MGKRLCKRIQNYRRTEEIKSALSYIGSNVSPPPLLAAVFLLVEIHNNPCLKCNTDTRKDEGDDRENLKIDVCNYTGAVVIRKEYVSREADELCKNYSGNNDNVRPAVH